MFTDIHKHTHTHTDTHVHYIPITKKQACTVTDTHATVNM